jgi:DNA-binding beta-propeller fold protein YncE
MTIMLLALLLQDEFVSGPTVVRDGDAVRIEFEVRRETDVTVWVENAGGKVVHHLAGGVLGKNAPEPLRPDSLRQGVPWDGKDDFGKPAVGGPFRARVRLGLKPEFEGFLMYNPDATGPIFAVATGPAGRLYAFHGDGTANGNMGGTKLALFSREGHRLRSLIPFAADLAPEKLRPLGVFAGPDGAVVPRVHNWETLSFYPDTVGVRGREMPDHSSSPAVDSKGRAYWLVKGPVLCAVDADGGIPYGSFLGPPLLPGIKNLRMRNEYLYRQEKPSLAVSGDERFLYFAGLGTGEFDKKETHRPLPCVFRVSTADRGPGEPFVGDPDRPGTEKELLTAPRGLAVAGGFLYVADPGAGRIAVFKESDRSFAGEIKVPSPQSLGVDPETGAVYACVYTGPQTAELVKFDGFKNGREVCRMELPKTGLSPNSGVHRIAVDASARPVLVWVPDLPYSRSRLKCVEDAGDRFVDRGDPRRPELFAEGPRDLSVDRVRDELYVKANGQTFYRFDEKTGTLKDTLEIGRVPGLLGTGVAAGTQLVAGTDANLYTFSWSKGLIKLDRQGKPVDWTGQKTSAIPIGGVMCFQIRHLAIHPFAPPEELFIVPGGTSPRPLNVLSQDGTTKRTAIWQCFHGAIPRVDAKGNIYLADMVKPPDRSYPDFFDGKLEPPPKQASGGDRFWNSYMYGSIIKFPPSGGAIWYKPGLPKDAVGEPPAELLAKPKIPVKVHYAYHPHETAQLQGALWTRFGYSPYSAHTSGMTIHCMCEGSGFDVDPVGRVFYPNLGQFRVEVVDTNNNFIASFGTYGNQDAGGPGIPLAWPVYVAVSDTHAYVADTVNRRVVKVRLGARSEATCEVK